MRYILSILVLCLSLGVDAQNRTFTANGVSFEMVKIEGGTFKMGVPLSVDKNECHEDCRPVHDVTLSTYYVGKFHVTQALWRAVMGELDCPSLYVGDNLPVDGVSWFDAIEFIEKLSKLTGEKFSLPTEAQWELAARGGVKNAPNSNRTREIPTVTTNQRLAVDKEYANEIGIYGMFGRMSEWCYDYHDYDYYKNSPKLNPQGPSSGTMRIVRSCDNIVPFVRWSQNPRESQVVFTFRVALNTK